jgi:hypothetical protein
MTCDPNHLSQLLAGIPFEAESSGQGTTAATLFASVSPIRKRTLVCFFFPTKAKFGNPHFPENPAHGKHKRIHPLILASDFGL